LALAKGAIRMVPRSVLALLTLVAVSLGTTEAAGTLPPDIELTPDSLDCELAAGDTAWSRFTISNVGGSPLDFRLGIPSSGLFPSPVVVSVQPYQGQVPPGGVQEIRVRLDARQLIPGWPVGTVVVIDTNDPDEPEIWYHVNLNVLPYRPIVATLDIRPDNLNVARGGRWLTAWVELPAEFDPARILVSSVRLGGTAPADPEQFAIKDHDHNGIPELSLKFDRSAVIAGLGPGGAAELVVTGNLEGGRPFIGQIALPVSIQSNEITARKSTATSTTLTTWGDIKSRLGVPHGSRWKPAA